MRFFWRIFLSVWAIVLITTVLTAWTGGWFSDSDERSVVAPIANQVIALISRELQTELARDQAAALDVLARDYALDSTPLLQIYILDPSGKDVLGRQLPDAVYEALVDQYPAAGRPARKSARVHVRSLDPAGVKVVAYEGFFPLAQGLVAPSGRMLYLFFTLIVSAAVSLLLARFIERPVRRLQLAGQKVAAGDLSVRVAHTVRGRADEIARLARDFDSMTERVEALLHARHRLLRDVSHELRSPLARIQALLSIARQKNGAANVEHIDRVEGELQRLDDLIGEILAYSRLEAREGVTRRATDIVDLVQNIVDDASLEGQPDSKDVQLHGPQRLVVAVDSGLIQSAVENVVRNAVKYTRAGTTVDVRIAEEQGFVSVAVEDSGPGVPEASIDRIFEAFYRVEDSRSTRSGTGGIGLAIARHSIRLHGGTISARNRAGQGLRVEIVLPADGRDSATST
jgi:two-component system sensor histidine kinase CpxA